MVLFLLRGDPERKSRSSKVEPGRLEQPRNVAGPEEQEISYPLTVRTVAVLEFRQLSGDPALVDAHKRLLDQATWRFTEDGSFVFAAPTLRADLYPVRGSFRALGNTLRFSAEAQARPGDVLAPVSTIGSVDLAGLEGEVSMIWTTYGEPSAGARGEPAGQVAPNAYDVRVQVAVPQ